VNTPNLIGKLLDRRYRTVRVLAAGGFGHTYLAEDTRRPNNPLCVVKHLVCSNQSQEMRELAIKMFHREAEVLEKLTAHPQIPQLLAYFEEDGEFYIVQQYIEGHSIAQELQTKENWGESKVRAFLAELLPILSFIHSQGVIHRDIKPSNILRQKSDGKLFLIDFGAIKQLQAPNVANHTLTSSTISIGTPGYMPIEQGMGKPRPSSDIFGLGMTVIHGATTMHPQNFREDEDGELIWQPFAQHLSPELIKFLERMVRSHFKERFRDGTEALLALQNLPALDLPPAQDMTFPQPLVAPTPAPKLVAGEVPTNPQEITLLNLDAPPLTAVAEADKTADSAVPSEPDTPNTQVAPTTLELGDKRASNQWRTIPLALVLLMGIGIWGWRQWQNHAETEGLLAELRNLQSAGEYRSCVQKSDLLLGKLNDRQTEIAQIRQSCIASQEQNTLANALKLLEQQKLAEAIALAQSIPPDSPSQPAAQKIINQAGEGIVSQLDRLIQAKADVAQVEALAKILPSTYRPKVSQKVRTYRQLWDKDKATVNKINQAYREQKWDEALELYNSLTIPAMQKQVQWISDRAQREIASRRIVPVSPSSPSLPEYNPPVYNPPPVYAPPSGGNDRPPPVYAD